MRLTSLILALGAMAALACPVLAEVAVRTSLPLTEKTKPLGRVVILTRNADPLLTRAAGVITDTVKRWSGVELPVEQTASARADGGPQIVLATLDSLREIDPSVEAATEAVKRVAFLDEQGFACVPLKRSAGRQVLVVSRTPRGVFNGATYLRDFLLDGSKDGLAVTEEPVLKTPQMTARGTYCLSIYGVVPQYTVKDWERIFDSFARDGMERVYFWVSGHFPSKKFPQTYNRDATTGTKIGTLEDLHALIKAAHDRGIKFYLGSGVFAWANAAYVTEGVAGTAATKAGGLCPSNPVARERTRDYFVEMIDALPEADGFFLEMRDEQGECQCPVCQKPVDAFGSKQYGQSEMTFLQDLARAVWRKHPHVRFSNNVGYAEHAKDVAFYQKMREMSDPRFEWLDCRWAWELPGPGGVKLPHAYFSHQVIHWGPFYSRSIAEMEQMCSRVAKDGLIGYVPAFEPGFATADYYSHEKPFAVDRVPYLVTGAAYRELTWEPALTDAELEQRLQARFFGREAPDGMGRDLRRLRDWIVENAPTITKFSQDWISYDTRRVPHQVLAEEVSKVEGGDKVQSALGGPAIGTVAITDPAVRKAEAAKLLKTVAALKKMRDEGMPDLARIEQRMKQAGANAGPKTAETLALMKRAIDDSRANFRAAVPDPNALERYEAQLAALTR